MSLESFFGSYLNDDYDVVDGTPEASVELFRRHQSPGEVRAAARELAALLASTEGDDLALVAAVARLGCGYAPSDPHEMRALLERARDHWREAVARGA